MQTICDTVRPLFLESLLYRDRTLEVVLARGLSVPSEQAAQQAPEELRDLPSLEITAASRRFRLRFAGVARVLAYDECLLLAGEDVEVDDEAHVVRRLTKARFLGDELPFYEHIVGYEIVTLDDIVHVLCEGDPEVDELLTAGGREPSSEG